MGLPSLEGLCPACLLARGLASDVLAAPSVRARALTLLGEGPSSVTYLAEDLDDPGAFLVLKRMRPDPLLVDVAARVQALRARSLPCVHRHIARVLDLAVEPDGDVVAITEFWPGIPITRFVERHASTDPEALWSQARAALDSAHAVGIVHGAVKPANLLVAFASGGPLLKVLDFGHEHLLGRAPAAGPPDPSIDVQTLEALRLASLRL